MSKEIVYKKDVLDLLSMMPPEDGITRALLIQSVTQLPSAQPEQPTGAQDILQYLDEYLHPIVSPEHWSVYSELYDMVSMLPSAQPEQWWIPCDKGEPDEDMECWVTVKTTDALYRGNFTKRYGERRDKGFITSGGFMWWNTALAWMPIYEPEPYKRGQDGSNKD